MFSQHHEVSEPSVIVTLIIPAKSVPEAWAKLPESLQVLTVDLHKVTPQRGIPDYLVPMGLNPERIEEMRDLAKRQTEATEKIAAKK